jgi:hypothetical protein
MSNRNPTWTEAEDEILGRLRGRGYSFQKIAKEISVVSGIPRTRWAAKNRWSYIYIPKVSESDLIWN